MQRNFLRNTVIARVLGASLGAAPAFAGSYVTTDTPQAPHFLATAAKSTQTDCFFRRDWLGGWKVSPDARTIYLGVSGSIYRLDLAASYPFLKNPFALLVNKGATDMICTPLDFDLTVSNRAGGVEGVIVKRMTRLTPAEAAALPRSLRP